MKSKLEERQEWVRSIIADACGGSLPEFSARIGKSDTYVRRMLWPKGKPNAKGIGEKTVDVIAAAFPNYQPPGERLAEPMSASGADLTHDDKDIAAIHMVFGSLLESLSENLPAAAKAFAKQLRSDAREAKFSTRAGLLADVLKIAELDRHKAEDGRTAGGGGGSPKR